MINNCVLSFLSNWYNKNFQILGIFIEKSETWNRKKKNVRTETAKLLNFKLLLCYCELSFFTKTYASYIRFD